MPDWFTYAASSASGLAGKIPATFWGVVAGSLFTLLGTWLTNRANERRLKKQFQHELQLKKDERELALKRDVYLPAVGGVVVAISAIGRLGNADVPADEALSDWTSSGAPALMRSSLVAGPETLERLVRFQTAFLGTVSRVASARIVLSAQVLATASALKEMNDTTAQTTQLTAQLVALQDPAATEQRRALIAALTERRAVADTAMAQHTEAARTTFRAQVELMKDCVRETAILTKLANSLMVSARNELGLPLNGTNYDKIFSDSQRVMEADFKVFVDRLEGFERDLWSGQSSLG